MKEEPEHHRRYRLAWDSYIDPDTSKECKKDLQIEMDKAQNEFEWDEFQIFKKTLIGYEELWAEITNKLYELLERVVVLETIIEELKE